MDTAQPRTAPPVIDERTRRADRKALLRLRRRYDDTEEVAFLNITAMMDMMTILLVFMLKSFSTASVNVNLSDELAIPASGTADKIEESVTVTVTKSALLVEGEAVVEIHNGAIPSSKKTKDEDIGLIINPLLDNLKSRADLYKLIAQKKNKQFTGALTIIADKTTPYELLTEVMYTAGEAEYWKYNLIVLEKGQ